MTEEIWSTLISRDFPVPLIFRIIDISGALFTGSSEIPALRKFAFKIRLQDLDYRTKWRVSRKRAFADLCEIHRLRNVLSEKDMCRRGVLWRVDTETPA